MRILDETTWLERLRARENPARAAYRAMYSTWWGGIVTDPVLMVMPMDDHQVHRGDGVFEAIKIVNGRAWLWAAHMDRLDASARAIGLENPLSRAQWEQILAETVRASTLRRAIARVFLSRGPGQFSANPYDSVGPQAHLVVTELKPLPESKIQQGVTLGRSSIPVKESWLARIKSCNYLQNVLMKKEAVDRGWDFSVGIAPNGILTEGSTENVMFVDAAGVLVRPRPEGILAGTTMLKAFEFAPSLQAQGLLKGTEVRDVSLEDLVSAREVMMAGTTLDVVAVTAFEGKPVGGGRPGPVATRLRTLLSEDQDKL